MTQDQIIQTLHKVVAENQNFTTWTVSTPHLVALVNHAIEAEREAWRNAAIRVGENLSTCGPSGYYDYTSQQWLDWALDATTKMQDDYMNLGACGEREACAKIAEEGLIGHTIAKAIRARGQA